MLRTLAGEPVACQGDVWVVAERTTYLLLAPASADVRLGARPLEWSGRHGGWLVPVGWWAAEQVVHVREADRETRLPIRAQPEATKLTGAEWAALLADLDAWMPGVTAGDEGGEHGGHAAHGVPLPLLAPALAGTAGALLDAVGAVLRNPCVTVRTFDEQRRLHAVRRADAAVVRWLGRHPGAARQMDWRAQQRAQDPFVRVSAAEEVLDHPANRFLAGQVRRVAAALREVGEALCSRHADGRELTDAVPWAHARGRRCLEASAAISGRLQGTWLARLQTGEPSEAVLSVLRGDPAYRRVHALCDAILRPRWAVTAPAVVPVRPTFTLYELWTFFWLARALERERAPGTWRRLDRLRSRTGAGAEWRDRGARLVFNRPFPGWPPPDMGQPHSLSGPRRPDLVLTVRTPTGPAWFALDAKYRVGRAALEDAFTSVHVYRDALRWPEFGGAPRGVLLIAPRRSPRTGDWFDEAYHARWGMGVVEARPGMGEPEVPAFLRSAVRKVGEPAT